MPQILNKTGPLRDLNPAVALLIPVTLPRSALTYTSALKLGEACSSETSVHIYHTTRRHIPEHSNLRFSLRTHTQDSF
jgi:hypothetical protein